MIKYLSICHLMLNSVHGYFTSLLKHFTWLENKITDINEKKLKPFTPPFNIIIFYLFWRCPATYRKQFSEENSRDQLNNWKKCIPDFTNIGHILCQIYFKHMLKDDLQLGDLLLCWQQDDPIQTSSSFSSGSYDLQSSSSCAIYHVRYL
jgi:hypothetical protein